MLTKLLKRMKRPPRKPPTAPIIKAPMRQSKPGAFCVLPSLMASELDTVKWVVRGLCSCLNMLSEKVAMVDAKNTFQVSEKLQKVFGFEIS